MARHDPIAQAAGSLDLFTQVSARLRERVVFDAAAWSATDPETGLVTAPMWVQNLDGGSQCYAYWECELLEETVIPFRELARSPTPAVQARAIASERDGRTARVRIRTRDGGWLACHASCLSSTDGLPGPTALIIEPAPASDMAPIIAEAYGLSPRELQITQHIARGLATTEIAAALFISAHTVRDHIKAIFDKTQVSSRGELVARLFTENYWPLRNRPGATAYGRV